MDFKRTAAASIGNNEVCGVDILGPERRRAFKIEVEDLGDIGARGFRQFDPAGKHGCVRKPQSYQHRRPLPGNRK